MFRASHKKVLLSLLVACFAIQTALVYGDTREPGLTADALRGREIYHEQACQVCHQLYGQGGFLGPDLTNAASRVSRERLASLLTVGSGQMPPLGLDSADIQAVAAFLEAIDRPDLGRGQLRLGSPAASPQAAFERVVSETVPEGSDAARGHAAVQARPCMQCHVPFETSPVGAPDLTTVAGRLSREDVDRVLREGRPSRGMPPPGFSEAELDAVRAYLEFLAENRNALLESVNSSTQPRSADWSRLPWWEF